MLGSLGIEKLLILAIVGLVVVGPERLPKLAADAGRLLRQLREMANGALKDVKDEMGGDLDLGVDLSVVRELTNLHPRTLIERHLLAEPAPARVTGVRGSGPIRPSPAPGVAPGGSLPNGLVAPTPALPAAGPDGLAGGGPASALAATPLATPFDPDAT